MVRVRSMDADLVRFLRGMEQAGLLDRTVVMLTSDTGQMHAPYAKRTGMK